MKSKLTIFLLILAFIAALSAAGLPFLVNRLILPKAAAMIPADQAELVITSISPHRLTASISISNHQAPSISLPRLVIDYSPMDLLRGRLNSLLIQHAGIKINIADGMIAGISGSKAGKDAEEQHDLEKILSSLPVSIDQIRFKDCNIFINQDGQRQKIIHLNGLLTADYQRRPRWKNALKKLRLKLSASGGLTWQAAAELQDKAGHYRLAYQGSLDGIPPVIAPLIPSKIKVKAGKLNTYLSLNLNKKNLQPQLIDGGIKAENLLLAQDNLSISLGDSGQELLHFSGSPKKIHYRLTGFRQISPLPLHFAASGEIKPDQTTAITGKYQIESPLITGQAAISGSYQFTAAKDGFTGLLTAENKEPVSIKLAGTAIDFSPMQLVIKANQKKGRLTASLKAALQDLGISAAEFKAAVKNIQTKAEITLEKGKLKGRINQAVTAVNLPAAGLQINSVSLNLPLQLEPGKDALPKGEGSLKIDKIIYNKQHLASLSGSLNYSSAGAGLSARLTTPLQKDFGAEITARSNYKKHQFALNIAETGFNSETLAAIFPIPDNITFNGRLAAKAQLGSSGPASASLMLSQTNIDFPESKAGIYGIKTRLELADLFQSRSKPSQLLTIEKIESGDIRLSNAKITYRIESPKEIFIEKTRVDWCGGKVESGSLALSSDIAELDTTLYCDRLDFAMLLNQFGIEGTEGTGSLNGRLPVHFSEKGIFLDDGFLFSTPGKSGIVHFNNLEMIRSGMPALDQTAALEYSVRALQNFAYDWSRLTFKSRGDQLTLGMELQGKPAVPLPFGYKNGQLVSDPKGGLQHPLRLDVNFNLPQEDIFRIGRNLQTFKENL
ncbi:MAG: hypothetical protein CSB24_04990 [Deltaproteobacteria bacterium]|nr:MAG: hypothetical protein CSB24_04990 [Deltaproteobacteria bacterium]